jgi:hypothetical protein
VGVKRVKISLQSPTTEFGAQNQYGRVTYPSIGNFTCSKKIYNFGGQKGENRPSEPKNGIRGQNKYDRVTCHGVRKNILLLVKKAKIRLQSPKTDHAYFLFIFSDLAKLILIV